jgi:hypothetical protein
MNAVFTVASTRKTTPGPAALASAAADADAAAAASVADIEANDAAEAQAEVEFQAFAAWRWATYDHLDVAAWAAVVEAKTAVQGVHDVADTSKPDITTKSVADLADEMVVRVNPAIAAMNVDKTVASLVIRNEETALSTTANTNAIAVRDLCYLAGANQKAVASSGPCT